MNAAMNAAPRKTARFFGSYSEKLFQEERKANHEDPESQKSTDRAVQV
jgi:hypothetical protein